MAILSSWIGRRVLLAAIAAVVLAVSPVVPGDQKFKAAGLAFAAVLVALMLLKLGGGGGETPVGGQRKSGESQGDGEAPRPSRPRAGVKAEATVIELGGVPSEGLLELMRADNSDEGLRMAATQLYWGRMRDEARGYGFRLAVPDILRVDPGQEERGSEITPELPDTLGSADSLLSFILKKLLRR